MADETQKEHTKSFSLDKEVKSFHKAEDDRFGQDDDKQKDTAWSDSSEKSAAGPTVGQQTGA